MKKLCYIAIGALLIGILQMPIGYYTFLRILITIISLIFLKLELEKKNNSNWLYFFGIVAIIFNPIIPVYLHDELLWKIIDIIVIFSYFTYSKKFK